MIDNEGELQVLENENPSLGLRVVNMPGQLAMQEHLAQVARLFREERDSTSIKDQIKPARWITPKP